MVLVQSAAVLAMLRYQVGLLLGIEEHTLFSVEEASDGAFVSRPLVFEPIHTLKIPRTQAGLRMSTTLSSQFAAKSG